MSKFAAKRQSAIRFEAVVPFAIIVVVVGAYFTLFFDHNLRKAIEWGVGYANGAEVNVGELKTSFSDASFLLRGLEITDYEQPIFNKLQLGEVRFQLSWDALLRAKILIRDASILDIALNVQRKKPGRILRKPEPPKPPPTGPSQIEVLSGEALAQTENKFKGNALGDIAGLLGGADPTTKLNDITSQLNSVKKANELQQTLANKQKQWAETLKTLPDDKQINDLKERVQAVQLPKDLKNLGEVKKAADQLQAVLKDADQQFRKVQGTATELTADLTQFQASIKGLDELARSDLKDIAKRVKLPELNAKEIAKSIFVPMLLKRLGAYAKYFTLAQKYMPTKSANPKKSVSEIPSPTRARGRTYQFGKPHGYPLFWLQHSAITSHRTPGSPLNGDVQGEIRDLTTDPPLIGKPVVIHLAGDFTAQNVRGLDALIRLDHTTDQPLDTLDAKVASLSLAQQILVDSPQVRLAFDRAEAASQVHAQMKAGELQFKLNNQFSKVAYFVGAENQVVKTTLEQILKDIPIVTLQATIEGSLRDLRLDLNSNLGDEIRKGFEKQLSQKIAQATAQIQAVIDQNLKGKKDELMGQFKQAQNQVTSVLGGKQAKVEDLKRGADSKSKSSQQNQLQEAGKKGLEDLKKKFGF